MLAMVMAKPIQVTIVRAVPFRSGSARCATRVEKRGESATTVKPQRRSRARKSGSGSRGKKSGTTRQQRPETASNQSANDDLSLEDYFQRFVLEHQDSMSETELARKLGVSRKCLWERRQRLGIPRKKPTQSNIG